MFRISLAWVAWMMSTAIVVAQGAYQTIEPPLVDPNAPPRANSSGGSGAAPAEPRRLPSLQSSGSSAEAVPVLTLPRGNGTVAPDPQLQTPTGQPRSFDVYPNPDSEVQPAQFVIPARGTSAPPIAMNPVVPRSFAEPPTPVVKIQVRGVETGPRGQELTYRLVVTNVSQARAHLVIVRCPVPKNVTFIRAVPEPKVEGKELEWHLDTLEAGASRQMDVVFRPNPDATEVTVVGRVQFDHGRYIKTRISNPTLSVQKNAPAQCILNEPVTFKIEVANNGKVAVSDIVVLDSLPEGFEYMREEAIGAKAATREGLGGHQRAWTVGTLQPGEKRTISYRAMTRKIGEWRTECEVTGSGVKQTAVCTIAIVDAKMAIQVEGPNQTDAKVNVAVPYRVMVHNTGSAALSNVRVSCVFPSELRLGRAARGGQFFKDSVQWIIPTLSPKETREFSLALIAPTSGTREINFSAKADRGLEQRQTVQTRFEGIEALNWTVDGKALANVGDAITYVIKVANPGSGPARNVQVTSDFPNQVEFSKADPSGYQRDAKSRTIYFNPFDIPPGQTITLSITTIARKSGDARFTFELKADGQGTGPLRKTPMTVISPLAKPAVNVPAADRIGIAPPSGANPGEIVPVSAESPTKPLISPGLLPSPQAP